jgi:hypothetical protein
MKTSTFVTFVFIILFPLTLIADNNTIVRNNLRYNIFSEEYVYVEFDSQEHEAKRATFKLDVKCSLEEYKLLIEASRNFKGEIIESIKAIFPEDKLYNEDGKFVITRFNYFVKPKTGEVLLNYITCNEDISLKNLDDNIHLFYNEFNKRVKLPPSNNESLTDSSAVILSMSFNITKPISQDEESSNIFVTFWNVICNWFK